MSYAKWNHMLGAHLFSTANQGGTVRLNISDTLLAKLSGLEAENARAAFVGAVQHDYRIRQMAPFNRAWQIYEEYERRQKWDLVPDYLAYLCLAVLAARNDGIENERGYYAPLASLLHERRERAREGFDRMRTLWDGLAYWSRERQHGRRGIFRVVQYGQKLAHVGLPIAQGLLTDEDLQHRLPQVFFRNRLDPAFPPTRPELAGLCVGKLEPRASRVLQVVAKGEQNGFRELGENVLDEIEDAVAQWDGRDDANQEELSGEAPLLWLRLRLWLQVDGKRCTSRLCVSAADRSLPGEMAFQGTTGASKGLRIWCRADQCSTLLVPLVQENGSAVPVDAIDWSQDLELRPAEETLGYGLRLKGRRGFLLGSGLEFNCGGWVQSESVSQGGTCRALVNRVAAAELETWARNSDVSISRLDIQTGLPEGWSLYTLPAIPTAENGFPPGPAHRSPAA